MTIEDVVLRYDKRGVSALRPHVPPDFCTQAARLVAEHNGTVLITTGFYILKTGTPETDGPPGAIAIGHALQRLGRRVVHVTDRVSESLMNELAAAAEVVSFPVADAAASAAHARQLLARYTPALLISIERCGRTAAGRYLNMRGLDVSAETAQVDFLFQDAIPSVGIGDGGNEIGMGNVADAVAACGKLVADPCVTRVSKLVIASVSNWGGYGLVAALSRLEGRDLLPTVDEERRLVERTAALGAVDGTTGEADGKVDGFTPDVTAEILTDLRALALK
ncbi:MAG TPA: DUF4392 domain-containing protein [Terriglobales bacterium]|nr:DUF4392 domain-containing protein [Terriglobales bacterium]